MQKIFNLQQIIFHFTQITFIDINFRELQFFFRFNESIENLFFPVNEYQFVYFFWYSTIFIYYSFIIKGPGYSTIVYFSYLVYGSYTIKQPQLFWFTWRICFQIWPRESGESSGQSWLQSRRQRKQILLAPSSSSACGKRQTGSCRNFPGRGPRLSWLRVGRIPRSDGVDWCSGWVGLQRPIGQVKDLQWASF